MEADTFHIFGPTVWKYVAMSPRLNNVAWLQSQIPVWLFGNTRASEVRKDCQWNIGDSEKKKNLTPIDPITILVNPFQPE